MELAKALQAQHFDCFIISEKMHFIAQVKSYSSFFVFKNENSFNQHFVLQANKQDK